MKVFIGSSSGTFKVFPNPIVGNLINLEMESQPADTYQVMVRNNFGQVVISNRIEYAGGTITQTLKMPSNVPRGVYQLEVLGTGGNIISHISLIY